MTRWKKSEVEALFEKPFLALVFQAQTVHRQHFDPQKIQLSTLLNVKTGACPEDCSYCSQSGHHKTGLQREKLLDLEVILASAKKAKANGATRFCMGAAWRSPPKKDMPKVIEMIKAVKEMGLETCATLGMLSKEQAQELKSCGLDYYNHNLDTSERYYKTVATTRTYQDRLDTLENVRNSGINVCCGGIMGLGEGQEDQVDLLLTLANLPVQPESVPINQLTPIPGTPFGNNKPVDPIDFVKNIAVARILMPKTFVRLSAGRDKMSETLQALCFMAGANSIHFGEKLLTVANPEANEDLQMLNKLGLSPYEYATTKAETTVE